jgi:hypothetical protein
VSVQSLRPRSLVLSIVQYLIAVSVSCMGDRGPS